MSTRRDNLLRLDLSCAAGVYVLGNGLQAAETINFVMRSCPRLRIRVVYRTARLVMPFSAGVLAVQAAVSAAYARCTSMEGKVECVGALVDSIREACSPTMDPSLVEYLDQFWRVLQRRVLG